eukprot:Skav207130  [mRNA]  locus=scaffold554:86956:89328:+ [translate_table: standard]
MDRITSCGVPAVSRGCHRLKLQLQKHQVPVKRFALLWQPWESLGATVLFGKDIYGFDGCLYAKCPVLGQHQLHKDFPEPGDCSYVMGKAIWIMRRSPQSRNHYRSVIVFSTPAEDWTPHCCLFLPAFCDMFHRAIDIVLNGPTMRDLRTIDQKMYLVLSMRSYNRGHPMIPLSEPCSEQTFTLSCGQHLGLVTWGPFKTHEKFHLSDYLRCFIKRLGLKLKTYNTLDGRKLVPYQCVVVRHDWEQLRVSFCEAFKVQKAAYRHANGGTSTPSLLEDSRPHFVPHSIDCAQPEAIKTVVRKTFLELDDGSSGSIDLKRSTSTGEVMTFFV